MADNVEDSSVATPMAEANEKKESIVSESKKPQDTEVIESYAASEEVEGHYKDVPLGEGIVPTDQDEFIDPRLKNYPIPLVAKTVDLRNDPS